MDFVAAIEATRRGKWKRRKLSLIFQISQINRITIERALVQPLSRDLVRESLEIHKFDDLFDSNWATTTQLVMMQITVLGGTICGVEEFSSPRDGRRNVIRVQIVR